MTCPLTANFFVFFVALSDLRSQDFSRVYLLSSDSYFLVGKEDKLGSRKKWTS